MAAKRRVHRIAIIVKNIGLFSSMPNKKLTKEENQPPITTLLPNCTKNSDTNRTLPQVSTKSATNPSANVSLESADLTIGAQTETSEQQFIEVKSNKKRKRRNRSSGSPKKKPQQKTNYGESSNNK